MEPANENPGQAGKGGARSSRKRRLGGGRGVSSWYTFCESRAHGRKGKQSRPTHPLTLVYVALIPTEDYTHPHTHTNTLTYCLLHLTRYIQGLRQRLLFHPIVRFQPSEHTYKEGSRKGCGGRTRVGNTSPQLNAKSVSGHLLAASEQG